LFIGEYINDNKGYGPITAWKPTPTGMNQMWYRRIWPYAFPEIILNINSNSQLNGTLFNCPVDTGHPVWSTGRIYCLNKNLPPMPDQFAAGNNGQAFYSNKIYKQSQACLIFESYDTGNGYWTSEAATGKYLTNHHNYGINVLFCDFHVARKVAGTIALNKWEDRAFWEGK
jgi:prepilin-type processing-associated H-X9-DG protein